MTSDGSPGRRTPGGGGRRGSADGGPGGRRHRRRRGGPVRLPHRQPDAAAPSASPRAPLRESQWWFTGAGAGLDHSSTLVLANVDPGPAVLDLKVLGPDGPVETVATEGITLAPHAVRRVDLSEIAPQTDDLALERAAPAAAGWSPSVDDSLRREGVRAARARSGCAGTDLPEPNAPARRPARDVLGRSTLLVANPSDLEAVVDVRVAGRSGTFAPPASTRSPSRRAPSRRSTSPGCCPKKEPVALRLRSRVPVVAVRAGHRRGRPLLRDPGGAAGRAGRRARRARRRRHACS